jgi:hypothetical protein
VALAEIVSKDLYFFYFFFCRRKSRVPSNAERGAERGPTSGKSARQQNLKQKFMALMKKFKVEGIGRAEQVELDRELSEAVVDPADIDYLVTIQYDFCFPDIQV